MIRSGIMKGVGAFGLPSTSSMSGKGSFSEIRNVRASVASMVAVAPASMRPRLSMRLQRWRVATQSDAFTGWPSCHVSPSRRTKSQRSLSGEVA